MILKKVQKIKTLSLYLCGFIVVCYILWSRFLRQRFSKTLAYFDNTYGIILITCNIILFSIILFKTICIIIIKEEKTPGFIVTYLKNSALANNLFNFFDNLLSPFREGPKTIYRLIYNTFNISHILEIPFFRISRFLMDLPIKYSFLLTIIHIVFHTIPRLIPPIIFLCEIFVYGYLDYFYKSLLLYGILLGYNLLLWILADLADNNIYFATAHINVKHNGTEGFSASFHKEIPPIKGAIDIISRKTDKGLLEWFGYIYETYCDIKWLAYRLDQEKQKMKIYETLLTSIFYLIGWSYILFKILIGI